MNVELAKGVYWVGVVDWGLRHFHGHELSTHRGSSYNAYLILDEKTVLVDTAWSPFQEEFLQNVRQLVDPAKIDIVVVNHSEPDHSGSLPAVMRHCPNATVVVSKRGADSVPGHYHQKWNFKVVGTGDKISIGKRELTFVEATMLHWPDSMFTYLAPDGILMPNDAFGQHYAANFRFNDQVNPQELYEEALKYFANILTPYANRVGPKIDELLAMKVPVNMIAPSHGIIWRKDPLQIVEKYRDWAAQKGNPTAVVLYDTMWQATRRMAEAIGDGLTAEGVSHKLFHVAISDRNDVLTEIFQARGVVIGSPTLNNGVLASVSPILEDLRGLRFQNKVGAAFGSYGWSGEAVKLIEEHFAKCNIPLASKGVGAKWQPTEQDLQACMALGQEVGRRVKTA
ncbi:MAG: MBL fold metallo-hydrolase [Phycisphaerae bacterium]|jgi:flavorubredoxin